MYALYFLYLVLMADDNCHHSYIAFLSGSCLLGDGDDNFSKKELSDLVDSYSSTTFAGERVSLGDAVKTVRKVNIETASMPKLICLVKFICTHLKYEDIYYLYMNHITTNFFLKNCLLNNLKYIPAVREYLALYCSSPNNALNDANLKYLSKHLAIFTLDISKNSSVTDEGLQKLTSLTHLYSNRSITKNCYFSLPNIYFIAVSKVGIVNHDSCYASSGKELVNYLCNKVRNSCSSELCVLSYFDKGNSKRIAFYNPASVCIGVLYYHFSDDYKTILITSFCGTNKKIFSSKYIKPYDQKAIELTSLICLKCPKLYDILSAIDFVCVVSKLPVEEFNEITNFIP